MRVLIVGGGRMIYFLARQFVAKGYHVTVINRDPEECNALLRHVAATVVLGNGSDPAVLADAEARRADVILALTNHDHDNLVICQIAQRLYDVPRTIALVNDPDHEEVFRQLGVSVVFSATRVISMLLEEQTSFDEIANLLPVANGKLNVAEVIVGADAPAVNMTLFDLPLPAGALIAGIMRGDQTFVPGGTARLQPADRVILVCQPEHYEAALCLLTGAEP